MRIIPVFLLLVIGFALVALPARAEDADTPVSDTSVTPTNSTVPPKPRPYQGTDSRPKVSPSDWQTEAKANMEERKALFEENQAERKALFMENQQERKNLAGTSTEARLLLLRENAAERKALFEENQGERRELLKEQLGERKEFLASTTALRNAAIEEHVKEQVLARAENAGWLLDAMLERLLGLAGRIEGRIASLAETGADTTAAEVELDEAYASIDAAEAAIADFKAAVKVAFETETPRESLALVKPKAEAAKAALRAAHEALKEAAEALPKLDVDAETSAGTDASL